MSAERQYRKMSIDEDERNSGSSNNAYLDDIEEAHRHLDRLRAEKEQNAAKKQRAAEIETKKTEFVDEQNYLGETLHLAIEKITSEIESMHKEMDQLDQIKTAFKKNLGLLSNIRTETWSSEEVEYRLPRAIEVIEACQADYTDATNFCTQMTHSKALTRAHRRTGHILISLKEALTRFQEGLAFHLPLTILLVIIYVIVSCRS